LLRIAKKKKKLLDAILISYNLSGTLYFPTRVQNNSSTALGSIFIDTLESENRISSIQWVVWPWCTAYYNKWYQFKKTNGKPKNISKIGKCTIIDSMIKLIYKTWDSIFDNSDVNTMFNFSLTIYLRIFYSGFSLKKPSMKTESNAWITLGIKTSCKHKRDPCLLSRISNDSKLKNCYKLYCKMLSDVVKELKIIAVVDCEFI